MPRGVFGFAPLPTPTDEIVVQCVNRRTVCALLAHRLHGTHQLGQHVLLQLGVPVPQPHGAASRVLPVGRARLRDQSVRRMPCRRRARSLYSPLVLSHVHYGCAYRLLIQIAAFRSRDRKNKNGTSGFLSCSLADLLKEVWSGKYRCISPAKLRVLIYSSSLVILENPGYYFFAFEQLIVNSYTVLVVFVVVFAFHLFLFVLQYCHLHFPPSFIYDNKQFYRLLDF